MLSYKTIHVLFNFNMFDRSARLEFSPGKPSHPARGKVLSFRPNENVQE
jgi:hypothetical protein